MQLLADGIVQITFGDTHVRVKAPNIGQYKRIRKEIAEKDAERRAQWDVWTTEIPDYPPTDPAPTTFTPKQTAAVNEITRRNKEYNEDALIKVWRLILLGEEMGDNPFPGLALDPVPTVNTDEWPLELLSPIVYNNAMNHWASVPLASGDAPAPAGT